MAGKPGRYSRSHWVGLKASRPSRLWFVLLLASCGSPSPGSPQNAAAVIAARGTPTVFQIECDRHAYDSQTQTWRPADGFVRTDAWLYAKGANSDLLVLVNGEVIKQQQVAQSISAYPNPGLDPRMVGCGEAESVITTIAKGPPRITTDGTPAMGQLTFGSVTLKSNYYVLGKTGLMATFANGKMIALVTL